MAGPLRALSSGTVQSPTNPVLSTVDTGVTLQSIAADKGVKVTATHIKHGATKNRSTLLTAIVQVQKFMFSKSTMLAHAIDYGHMPSSSWGDFGNSVIHRDSLHYNYTYSSITLVGAAGVFEVVLQYFYIVTSGSPAGSYSPMTTTKANHILSFAGGNYTFASLKYDVDTNLLYERAAGNNYSHVPLINLTDYTAGSGSIQKKQGLYVTNRWKLLRRGVLCR